MTSLFDYFNAIRKGNIRKINELFESGSFSVSTTNSDGFDGLIIATIHDNQSMIDFFIEKGANINVRDNKGWSLLHIAAYNARPEQYRYLVSKGVDINHRNNKHKLGYQNSPPHCKEEMKALHKELGGEIDDSTDNVDNFDPVSPNPFSNTGGSSTHYTNAIEDEDSDSDARE